MVKAQVAALDEAVANVTLALERAGMMNNTIFVFMGDNGGPTFEGHSNTPLRGGKLNFFEGGVRPASFVYSELLPPGARGTWYTGIIHETDWAATFLALASVDAPTDPLLALSGFDVWPTLMDPTHAVPHRTEALVADHILRQGRWKLVTGAGTLTKKSGKIFRVVFS